MLHIRRGNCTLSANIEHHTFAFLAAKFPKVSPKTDLRREDLGNNLLLVRGCLTEAEARRFVETAESMGFQHQGSRGAAYGEGEQGHEPGRGAAAGALTRPRPRRAHVYFLPWPPSAKARNEPIPRWHWFSRPAAFRDNDRIQLTDAALAEQLWQSTGLALALRDLQIDGARAVGLNPNLRFYRWAVAGGYWARRQAGGGGWLLSGQAGCGGS